MKKLFRPQVRSRHGSHDILRNKLPLFPFKSVIRFGSDTVFGDEESNGGSRIEINTVNAIKNSSNKRLMKQCFNYSKIKTAEWFSISEHLDKYNVFANGEIIASFDNPNDQIPFHFPIVAKSLFGSRGEGNYLLKNVEELGNFLQGRKPRNYIFEKYYNYVREYRLHVTKDGCFYTCRKLLKTDTPEDKKWFRNDSNCVWVKEDNDLFDKPVNWDTIVQECVKALEAVGLDFGAMDVRVQSAKDKKGTTLKKPDFIIIETNSAPSFGDITAEKYLEILPQILNKKANVDGRTTEEIS